ncbi:HAMP domain-containing sensor histidine kinase [Microcoleus sp. bin38.metabat.b11b12b14.051]|uniref:sensor histidine kinase n=1 Tax=Microcoleus sp. bin38.metabat.b11b12b14.051 TaxID=2742709 RepID=UPI0025E5514A|nr:HAMP domain-containing sensor histidine kinase [Microcoleus sp. bin38.metabat.b11b12b14.051]
MAWVIGSTKTSNPQFQALGWRLLLSYLTVMIAILGTSAVAVYELFASTLYQELDQRLEVLSQAASHSLVAIEKQYFSQHSQEKSGLTNKENRDENNDFHLELYSQKVTRQLDKDGDLDIPWQNLREADQSVEWFNETGQMLGNAGKSLPPLPIKSGFKNIQNGQIRSATIPVYIYDGEKQELKGYIRSSESTKEVEEVLSRLRWNLGYGSIIFLSLTGVGGLWLTKQSLKPIEESFQQLKQFTADASHELRNPLTAIKTSVEVMQNHPERIHAADVKKMVAIASATRQMSQLVEDLLLLTRIDAAATTITREWVAVPLDELLEDLLDFWELQAQEKQITLKSNLGIDTSVMGDGSQLTRLFSNLIGNAIHYTPTGGIVTVSLRSQGRLAIVSVQDTGIGIAPEDVKLVFDRFWRADRARSCREGGLGMGLAIAQSIVQSHRGEISVTSQLGVGSCFQVKFPSVT